MSINLTAKNNAHSPIHKHQKWNDVLLPLATEIKASSDGCPAVCASEIDLIEREAFHRMSCTSLWKSLVNGYPSGTIGGFDSSTVDIGGLRRAYDQVIATGAESSSPTCRRLCTIARAVLVVREAVAIGEWSDKSDKKNQRFNERTGKYDSVQKSSVVSITAALNQAQQILGSVGGVTEGTLVAVGIPQAVLDACRSSSKINGKATVEFIPTDEMNFIKSERDDYEMVRSTVVIVIVIFMI